MNDAFEHYECRLEIWRSQQESAFRHRSGLKMRASQSQQEYWGKIYVELAKHNSPFMTRAMAAYFDLRQEHGLSDLDLAKAVVNSVQSIPYVLIYRDDCAELPRVNPALAKMAAEHGCKGNVSYGLQAPAEFLYDFKGDCDTRTVFLFTVLDKMGYRVAVLNSDRHGHSMLGVALPGVGKYKEYRGQKFYFWETTASGWNMGTLPPDLGVEQDWYVVLAN
jgi:hypothetical protein